MTSPTVLLIQPAPVLAEALRDRLQRSGALVTVARDVSETNVRPATGAPDLILLGVDIGQLRGFEVVRMVRWRETGEPILVLQRSATRDAEPSPLAWRAMRDSIRALVHLRASGRRPVQPSAGFRYRGAHLAADFDRPEVRVDGAPVALTPRELHLLRLLVTSANTVVLRGHLLRELWGYETRSLDVHIRRLRVKLGAAGEQIETLSGLGYRFVEAVPSFTQPERKALPRRTTPRARRAGV